MAMPDSVQQVVTELLVLRAQAGQGDAIGMLFRIWQERLRRHAHRLTGRDEVSHDVMQECWIDIARGLRRLDDPACFGPWAYRIVARRCARWIRNEQRRRQREQANAGYAAESTVTATKEHLDTADAMRAALRQLPVDQRMILELRYVEDYAIAEIAQALGIAAGTVKSRLFHARQQLREAFSQVTK